MGFRRQQRHSHRTSGWLRLGFWLVLPLVALGVHAMLSLPLWLLQWLLDVDARPRGFFWGNMGMALLLILGGWWLEHSHLQQGGGVALARRLGGRMADAAQPREQVYINVVQELCVAARMPAPAIMVLDRSAQINALAAGWRRGDQAVLVTAEALAELERDELQGVVAHELSHIREGDTALNMQLAAMVFGLQMVYGYGRTLANSDLWTLRLFGGLMRYAGLLGWLAGCALQAGISRQREYLADARAVEWTRQSRGLAGALRKICAHNLPHDVPRNRLADLELMGSGAESLAVAHLWIASSEDFYGRLARWLDSHPPIEQRLLRLQQPVRF